ncbi:MAG: hypothetical protein AAGA30_13425 [Planctomycetota bacterium]
MNEIIESQPSKPTKIQLGESVWIDRWADVGSDWFSPILVKETRQALKSRQFFWTFFLLLAAVGTWTMIGLTVNDSRLDLGDAGPSLLSGYWVILGFPLAIVIPFGTYRSLAREYEDGTIQLISVTTMKAWQIVSGKLGSSLLQMVIYLSVMAPCIAFTYLLRGLSIPQIAAGLLVSVVGSFGLCCIALFFASATRSRAYGVGVSILLIVLQCVAYFGWCAFAVALSEGEIPISANEEGILIIFGLLTVILTTGLLMFAGAASLISFESDNRSTLVRCMMLLQQTLFVGWIITTYCYSNHPEQTIAINFVSTHYWLLMGFILVGESPHLSSRVCRSLPGTLLGRSLFSLFMPGPGRGLIFAVTNLWLCASLFLVIQIIGYDLLPGPDSTISNRYAIPPGRTENYLLGNLTVCMYGTLFISLVYLFCAFLRRQGSRATSVISFFFGIVLVAFTTGFSLLYHYNFLRPSEWRDYSIDQFFNWYWTTYEITQNGFSSITIDVFILALVVMAGIILFALIHASRELLIEKTAVPEKVRTEIERVRKFNKPAAGESIEEIFGTLEPTTESKNF